MLINQFLSLKRDLTRISTPLQVSPIPSPSLPFRTTQSTQSLINMTNIIYSVRNSKAANIYLTDLLGSRELFHMSKSYLINI